MRYMASVVALLVALLPITVFGIAWQSVAIEDIRDHARFIGTVILQSGQAQTKNDDPLGICAVSYSALVVDSALGPIEGTEITLHMLKDHREDMELGFLEIGSKYFVFAGDRNSHRFVQITDVFDGPGEVLPDTCHASEGAFYVFPEFSGKLKHYIDHDYEDNDYLMNRYLRQVEGVSALKSLYFLNEPLDIFEDALTWREQVDADLKFLGVNVEALLEFFEANTE